MKLIVTCVDFKLKNQPDVLPKSSCYIHPLLINNLYLHATWQKIGRIFASSNFYLNQSSSLKRLFRIIKKMMTFMLQSLCVVLKWSWLISSWSPFYDFEILFWCFNHIENVDKSLASEPPSIYKSKSVRAVKTFFQNSSPLSTHILSSHILYYNPFHLFLSPVHVPVLLFLFLSCSCLTKWSILFPVKFPGCFVQCLGPL